MSMQSIRPAIHRVYPSVVPIIRFGESRHGDRYALWDGVLHSENGIVSPWMTTIHAAYEAAFMRLPDSQRYV